MKILMRVLLTVTLWFPGTVAAETVSTWCGPGAYLCDLSWTWGRSQGSHPVTDDPLVRRHHDSLAGVPC
jgi:hypothetical protein